MVCVACHDKTKNIVMADKFDALSFEEICRKAEKLQKSIREYASRMPTVDGLAGDIFYAMFKYVVRENPDEIVLPEYRINRVFVKKLQEIEEYRVLRAFTRLQAVESAIATCEILRVLIDEILPCDGVEEVSLLFNRYGMRKLREICREVISNLQAMHELLNGWGTGTGVMQQLPCEEKFEIAEELKYNRKIVEIARLAGRFRDLAIGRKQRKVQGVPHEMYAVSQGDDLSLMLPIESVYLAMSDAQMVFAKKFAEKQLLEYALKTGELQAGPLIVCVDNSGSMEGEREIWSKAIALALLEIARREKRAFVCIHFGDRDDPLNVIEIKKTDKPDVLASKIIELAGYFLNGGTNFEKPLEEALRYIESVEYRRADIVFITDGECVISQRFISRFLEAKKSTGFRMVSVVIAGSTNALLQISDMVIQDADIRATPHNPAEDVFAFLDV
jgi:uncharacterized protein with von Willebrand factor type A (vWA) domain